MQDVLQSKKPSVLVNVQCQNYHHQLCKHPEFVCFHIRGLGMQTLAWHRRSVEAKRPGQVWTVSKTTAIVFNWPHGCCIEQGPLWKDVFCTGAEPRWTAAKKEKFFFFFSVGFGFQTTLVHIPPTVLDCVLHMQSCLVMVRDNCVKTPQKVPDRSSFVH